MVVSIRAIALGAGLCLLAPPLFGEVALPLGVQACDTECQTKETDCDLACDQVASCVDECRKVSEACTVKCREPKPPAPTKPDGSAKPAAPPEKAPAAPEKKAPAKPAPAKPAPAKP